MCSHNASGFIRAKVSPPGALAFYRLRFRRSLRMLADRAPCILIVETSPP